MMAKSHFWIWQRLYDKIISSFMTKSSFTDHPSDIYFQTWNWNLSISSWAVLLFSLICYVVSPQWLDSGSKASSSSSSPTEAWFSWTQQSMMLRLDYKYLHWWGVLLSHRSPFPPLGRAKTFLYSAEVSLLVDSIHFSQICPLEPLRIGINHFPLMKVTRKPQVLFHCTHHN